MDRTRRYLVVVVDDDICVLRGARLFLGGLYRAGRASWRKWEPVVLCPSWAEALVRKFWQDSVRCVVVPHSRTTDRYAVKLILAQFVQHLEDDDAVLYLDYDHVCLRSFVPPEPSPGCVMVSSEPGNVATTLGTADLPRPLMALDGEYYSNSLIAASASTLRRIGAVWPDAYASLTSCIPARFREESAFIYAAVENGYSIERAPLEIQGGWHGGEECCSVFHYGGVNEAARLTKAMLGSLEVPGKLDPAAPETAAEHGLVAQIRQQLRVQ